VGEKNIIEIEKYFNETPVPFRKLVAIQKYLDLYIGNDTGLLHSAVATGIHCIGIYTATSPNIWGALNKNIYKCFFAIPERILYS